MEKIYSVLLVDDDLSDIELMKIQFDKINLNLKMHSVHNQKEFEDYFTNQPLPDLVVCDYQLPEYNGEKALKFVRDRHEYVPFILVTGYLNEEGAVELMKKGASDIITKQKLDRLGPAAQRELINFKERIEAQQEIDLAHNRFRSLVEQGGDVMVVLNDDGFPEYISPSIENTFGYSVEEAMSIKVNEITHPDDFHYVEKALKQAKKSSGENISVPPVRMKHKDGTWRWCKTSLTDLRHQPSVAGIVDNIRDIHEQILNARNNKLMLNNSEDSFVYINRELIIQSFNDRFAKNYRDILGGDVKRGESILKYTQPERRKIVKNIYDRVLRGETIEGELPFETKDGKTRYFQIKYKPARDENENIIGSFISLIEITDEKEAKLELEKNEARYRALVENASDVLFILEPDGNPKYISPSIKNVLGYTAEEAMQIDLMENAHPDDVEMIMGEIKKCLNHPGVPLKVPPARLQDKDGNWHWFEGTITNMLHNPAIEGIVDNFHEITERVEAEQKTAEAKNQYQSLVQSINGVFWEAEPNTFKVTYMSPQSKKMFGYDPDDWIEAEGFWINRIHPDDRKSVENLYRSKSQTGENHELEYRFENAEGEYIWIRDIISIITKNGKPEVIRGLMTNIHQEKELELKLEQAYQLAKIGNWELDVVNEKLYWSKFIKELHKVDEDFEPTLDKAINFYKEGWSRDTISKAVEDSIKTGESFDLELPIATAKGNERWIRAVGRPEFVNDTCVRLYGSTQDITDRKKAQIDRQKAEEKYRNVVEHSTNMFYQHDTEGVLTYVSPQSQAFLGLPPEEAVRDWAEFITDHPINKKGEEITQKAIGTGEVQEPYEMELRTADDRIIWVEVNEAPLKKEGEVVGIVGALTDISERKQFEEELKESLKRYNYASKATRDAIYDWDIKKDHLHWGDGFKRLFGHESGGSTYPLDKYIELVHPDDVEEGSRKLEKALKDSSTTHWKYEYRFQNSDGSYAYVVENAYIIRNEEGEATRMIGAIRDVTETKKAEISAKLQREVAQYFTDEVRLKPILSKMLEHLAKHEKMTIAEVWMSGQDGKHLNLISSYGLNEAGNKFINRSDSSIRVKIGEGLLGNVIKNRRTEIWDNIDKNRAFVRYKSAKKAGIKSAFGIPLLHNEQVVGVLLMGSEENADKIKRKTPPFETLKEFLGAEIKRKQQEEEMQLLFESAPDILAIVSSKNKFVKVNPAFCEIIGYSEEEITGQNFENFIHPDDLKDTRKEYKETVTGERRADNYLNRWRTKSGDYRWISWSSSDIFGEDEFVFAFGRDVTERIELEELLGQAQKMAKIGGWEVDLVNDQTYWSPVTKKIHEVPSDFEPNLDTGIHFYKEGKSRDTIRRAVQEAIDNGTPFDVELQIVTAKENERWIRAKAEPEIVDGKCVRLYGSFQDINDRKEAEVELDEALKEKEKILESIGDAFFAVNEDWKVTYWNKMAEKVLQKPREEIVGKNLWEVYEDATDLKFYTQYHKAVNEKVTVHFEEYYPTLNKWFEVSAYPSENGLSVYFKDISDRKQAILQLEQAYKEKETILESIEDGFFTLNRDWIVTYWNSEAENLLHTPKEKILGENLWDVFDDAVDLPSYKKYHKVMNEGVSVSFEDYYEPIDSWFDVNAYPSDDGISVYFKDITKRKENEEKIKRINERFEKVTEATNDAIWDFDVLNNNLYWGKGFETLFGYDLEKTNPNMEFLISLIHSDDRDRVAGKIESFMTDDSKKDWFEEYRFKKADGDYAYVMDRAIFIRNDDGDVIRVVGAMTDLSRQVEEEKQLKLYESVVTNTQESVVITEAETTDLPGRKIIYVNEAFTRMTGYRKDEVLGRSLSFLNGPNTDEETLGKLRNAINHFEPVEVEFINYKKSGEEFWVNTSMVPVRDSKGTYTHWVAIGRDVTARRNYENDIQTSLAEKEMLLAEIHHRVKNNLAVISGMMQLQAFESDNSDLQDKLFDSVFRIKTMATVHELLYQTNSFSNIDFTQTVETLANNISNMLESGSNVDVQINSVPIRLNINQAIPVSLVINEVMTNAYKHAFKNRKKGIIEIDLQETENHVDLQISDNGIGLPDDFDKNDLSSMGLKLIHVLSDQINASYEYHRLDDGTRFVIAFQKTDAKGAGNVFMA